MDANTIVDDIPTCSVPDFSLKNPAWPIIEEEEGRKISRFADYLHHVHHFGNFRLA